MRLAPVALAALLLGCGATPARPSAVGPASTASSSASASGSTGGQTASSSASSSSGSTGSTASTGSTGSTGATSSTGTSGSTGAASTSSASSSGGTSASSSASSSSGGSSGSTGSTGSTTALLLNGTRPMPCADPAVFSEANAAQVFYVYCTGMSHVWKTSDWQHFTDERSSTQFVLTGMSANGKHIGAWWAPGIVYAPGLAEYVMWVSVPDALGTQTSSGWDTRSLAVLTAPSPTGPWTFQGLGLGATAAGQHFIDPFLFRDPNGGGHYVFYKRYGGGVSSRIMGAHVSSDWTSTDPSNQVEIMDGYGGPGSWEDNVRENPAVWYDPATGHHHLLFSGGHWADDSYATGHAVSSCGPLCLSSGGWHMVSSGDRGVVQAVQSSGDANFTSGGPGGAVFLDDTARDFIYAAAARSASGDATRYLMRDHVKWANDAPYVDTAHHRPHGL